MYEPARVPVTDSCARTAGSSRQRAAASTTAISVASSKSSVPFSTAAADIRRPLVTRPDGRPAGSTYPAEAAARTSAHAGPDSAASSSAPASRHTRVYASSTRPNHAARPRGIRNTTAGTRSSATGSNTLDPSTSTLSPNSNTSRTSSAGRSLRSPIGSWPFYGGLGSRGPFGAVTPADPAYKAGTRAAGGARLLDRVLAASRPQALVERG